MAFCWPALAGDALFIIDQEAYITSAPDGRVFTLHDTRPRLSYRDISANLRRALGSLCRRTLLISDAISRRRSSVRRRSACSPGSRRRRAPKNFRRRNYWPNFASCRRAVRSRLHGRKSSRARKQAGGARVSYQRKYLETARRRALSAAASMRPRLFRQPPSRFHRLHGIRLAYGSRGHQRTDMPLARGQPS